MAKFFNQKVKKGRKKKNNPVQLYVILTVVGILILIAIYAVISVSSRNSHKDSVIKLRDKVTVEINNKTVDKTLFFAELENVKESDIKANYNKVDFTKLGTYTVTLVIYNKKYETKLEVVDTEAPVLKTKDVTIKNGETYKPEDFVSSCKDNSNKECTISFYALALTQDGSSLDYSKFTDEGTYQIQIVASDEANNKTTPVTATLTIGKGSTGSQTCYYGSGEYDTSKILSVNVTDNGCALDLNLYNKEETLLPVKETIENEESKLKNELSKVNLGVKTVYINSEMDPILNLTGNGVVGYTVKMIVSVYNANDEKEIIEEYYLNSNGSRDYIINKYL